MKKQNLEYTDEFKKELNKRYADYKRDKIKLITAEESIRGITNLF